MLGDPKVNIILAAKDMASGDIKRVRDAMNGMAKSSGFKSVAQGFGMGIGISAWGALSAGVSKAAEVMGDAVKAAIADEESQNRLRASLEANVPAWDGTTKAIEENILSAQRLGFSDEVLRDSLTVLVGATHDVSKAQDIMGTAMDLARYKGIDLRTASEALIKVEGGHYRSLAQLGIKLREGASQTEAMAAVQAVAAGQAEAFGNTTAGAMESAQIAIDEVVESLGKELVPAVKDAAKWIREDLAPALTDATGTMGHYNWAMAEQRRNSSELWFWQRGLLGLWTDGAQSAEAYAEAMRITQIATEGTTVETTALVAELGIVGDTTTELHAAYRESLGPATQMTKDVTASTRDYRAELALLRAGANKVLDGLMADLDSLEGRRNVLDTLFEGLDDPTLRTTVAEKIKTVLSDSFNKGLRAADPEIKARHEAALRATAEEAVRVNGPDFRFTGKSLAAKMGNGFVAEAAKRYYTDRALRRMQTLLNQTPLTIRWRYSTSPSGNDSRIYEGKAVGGPVAAGRPYVVGEEGPELFVPTSNGTIIPNGSSVGTAIGGGGDIVIQIDGREIARVVDKHSRVSLGRVPQPAKNTA